MKARVVLLPGDGIGPEIIDAAWKVTVRTAELFDHSITAQTELVGGAAIDDTGDPFPEATQQACRNADAVLLGAVGGPKWDNNPPATRPEKGLLALRKLLSVWANLRPVRVMPGLESRSPLKSDIVSGVDILFVRELTGGIYFGQPRETFERDGERHAVDTLHYSESEISRVVDLACRLARRRRGEVTSVDKANVLDSSRLWRDVASAQASRHQDVRLEHQLVDSCAMRIVSAPRSFDVVVTENMFGDILTDEAAVLAGSLGLLPSASIGDGSTFLYEPIHGSAPDIAGQGIANPVGAILSAAMMWRFSFEQEPEARAIETAVEGALASGARTADLGGSTSTEELTEEILNRLARG